MTPDTALDREDSPADRLDDDRDPRQLVLPYVDTAIDITKGQLPVKVTAATAVLALPALGALVAGFWFLSVTGRPLLGAGCVLLGTLLAIVAVLGRLASSWAIYPHERVLDTLAYARRRLSYPWGYHDALERSADLHGVADVVTVRALSGQGSGKDTYAAALAHDGTVVIPIRIRGGNTAHVPSEQRETMAARLTQGLDSELGRTDTSITFHATTRPADSSAAAAYQARARRQWQTRLSAYGAGLLGEVGEWVTDRDQATGANETRHYLLARVTQQGETPVTTVAKQTISRIQAALERVDGVRTAACSTAELCSLVGGYWERSPFPDDDVGEAAARAAVCPRELFRTDHEPRTDTPGRSPAERLLTPRWFREHPQYIEVGDAVARTLWFSTWPARPQARWLHDLYTMDGVDLDVTIHAHNQDSAAIESRLKRLIPRIDAEGMERAEQMHIGALTLDDKLDYYILAYKLLQESNTEPWAVSGYVTVRAPDVERLTEACERVEATLTAPPAQCGPVAPFGDQYAAFRSAAPVGVDHYARKGEPRRRARKTHLGFGGALGAILPATTADLDEPDGIRWGRDTATGRTVQADPFAHGPAGHLITVGPTGSGKTFAVEQATQEWWLNGDDRTLVYCDTQGGFEDAVAAFDADHVVIDGDAGINPFDIRPGPAADRLATDGGANQYRLKVEETVAFFAGILESHGVDPAAYHAVIEQAVERTFREAEITPDPATHDRASPTPADFFETLRTMADDPEAFTFTGSVAERDHKTDRVAGLLDELSGFQPGGKYHHLLEATGRGLDAETDLAYLDMRHLAGQSAAEKSVSLQLAVGQLTQLIKQTDGETLFVLDEAHNLLYSDRLVEWLDKAVREWRRYDAGLWFVTQSPRDFLSQLDTAGAKRETILEQCSTTQLMNCAGVDPAVLERFGLPDEYTDVATDHLEPGDTPTPYAECLLSFHDERGWIRTRVEASPALTASLEFSHRSGRSYVEQMQAALEDRADA